MSSSLADKNPLDQYNELSYNLEEFKTNMRGIIQNIQPLVKSGLFSACEISKVISQRICWVTNFMDNSVVNNEKLIDSLIQVTKLPRIESGMTNQTVPFSFF